jgi:hypothetical protein
VASEALQMSVLGEAQIEERLAGERLDERLDHAAHARGHAAREDAQRDLAAAQRFQSDGVEARVLGGPGDGRVDDVAGRGRLDRAGEAIARLAALAEIARPGAEPLRIEAARVEAGEGLGGERGELLI